jgi:hypothetical protein
MVDLTIWVGGHETTTFPPLWSGGGCCRVAVVDLLDDDFGE